MDVDKTLRSIDFKVHKPSAAQINRLTQVCGRELSHL